MKVRPLKNMVLTEKLTEEQATGIGKEFAVKIISLSYLQRPSVYYARTIAVGPRCSLVSPGDIVMIPKLMEPSNSLQQLIEEDQLLAVVDPT